MKIGVNARMLIDGRLEGVGLFSHEVLRRVVAGLPDDEFLFFFDRSPSEKFIYGHNVKGVVVPPQARHPFLWYLWFEHTLPSALKKYGAEMLLSPEGYDSLRCGLPSVITIHDLAFLHYKDQVPFLVQKYFNYYTPRFAAAADRILTVSEFSKMDIVKSYGIAEEKITVTGNGCDSAIRPLNEEEKSRVRKTWTGNSPYFIYVGSIHPRKNTARLLEAFDRFKSAYNCEIKLLLVGRWAWKTQEIRNVLNDMDHKSDVISIGHLEREELGHVMGASLALIYPSVFEGFGIPLLEAMYAEVPVITSNVSSMPEVAGDAAILVDPYDVDGLAAAMSTIARDNMKREELVEKGRAQRLKYSWDIAASRVIGVINEIKKGC